MRVRLYSLSELIFRLFHFGLQEINEAERSQGRAITLLDRDSLGDEVELTQIILAISFLMQVVDDTDQTRLQLLDAITTAHLANQAAYLLVEVLVLVHPRVNHTSRNKLILVSVRHGHDRLHLRAKRRKIDFVHSHQMRRRRYH